MTGMVLLVVGGDGARYRAALSFALAQRALDAAARVHLHDEAVARLADHEPLLVEALDAGVSVSFCQTGLAAAGLRADMLDSRLVPGGPISVLAGLGESRLVVF